MSGYLKKQLTDLSKSSTVNDAFTQSSLKDVSQQISQRFPLQLEAQSVVAHFFDLLLHLPAATHAQSRKDFWLEYVMQGHVRQSWFCLTPSLKKIADDKIKDDQLKYATLKKDHRLHEHHGILLMRFAHFTISEWSHLGKCRIWYAENPHAPKLFQKHYDRKDFIKYPNIMQQHYFSKLGRWQKKAQEHIDGLLLLR